MAVGVPPPPLNSPAGSFYWLEWYTSLTTFLNGTNIPWSNINFTGSNITDIINRNHNDLNNIQGGTTAFRYHLLGAGQSDATGGVTKLPLTWTLTRTGTGVYQITHGLNIPLTDMIVLSATNGLGLAFTSNDVNSVNTFVVSTFAPSGTPTDLPFTFMCTTI